jgi:hypothetical protein
VLARGGLGCFEGIVCPIEFNFSFIGKKKQKQVILESDDLDYTPPPASMMDMMTLYINVNNASDSSVAKTLALRHPPL